MKFYLWYIHWLLFSLKFSTSSFYSFDPLTIMHFLFIIHGFGVPVFRWKLENGIFVWFSPSIRFRENVYYWKELKRQYLIGATLSHNHYCSIVKINPYEVSILTVNPYLITRPVYVFWCLSCMAFKYSFNSVNEVTSSANHFNSFVLPFDWSTTTKSSYFVYKFRILHILVN